MSAQVKKVLAPLKPVCNVVKSNSTLLTTVLFLVITLHMLPLDLVTSSNIRNTAVSKVNSLVKSAVGRVLVFLLFVCLYVNADVENMVLLLYVFLKTIYISYTVLAELKAYEMRFMNTFHSLTVMKSFFKNYI